MYALGVGHLEDTRTCLKNKFVWKSEVGVRRVCGHTQRVIFVGKQTFKRWFIRIASVASDTCHKRYSYAAIYGWKRVMVRKICFGRDR